MNGIVITLGLLLLTGLAVGVGVLLAGGCELLRRRAELLRSPLDGA